MDLSRVMVFFLTHLIKLQLHFNSAESGDSDALQDVASDETTTPYIPARFTWASKGAPRATTLSERRDQASLETDDEDLDPQARVLYWIPTTCDSMLERGYTCVGCGESLHCMANNFALKAVCYGRRPYCNNGVCSYIRGEKCQKEGVTPMGDPAVQAGQHIANITDPAIQDEVMPLNSSRWHLIGEIETLPANMVGDTEN